MNVTNNVPQLQGTTVLTQRQISETRELAFTVAGKMSDKQLLTHMGILNSLIWRAAVDYEAITKDGDKYLINHKQWNNLLLCSVAGEVQITVPIDWTEQYLKSCWPGTFHTNVTLRTYRRQQLDWGLFWYDIENRPRGAAWGDRTGTPGQGIATPPVLEQVDIGRILIFYQVFDQVRRDRINAKLKHSEDITAFNCMPNHGGMLMVELYNALNISDFWGNVGALEVIAKTQEALLPAAKVIVWQWRYKETPHDKESQHLYRSLWQKMVERAGFVVKQALKTVTQLVVEPLGRLEEVPF